MSGQLKRPAFYSVIALLASVLISAPALGASLRFAVFGDVYMTPEHQGYLKGMLDDMAAKKEALAIFTGGIKPVGQSCQDNNLVAAYPLFAKAPLPTFYVPGDAEWILCAKYAPEDRLQLLRKTYYQNNMSLGEPALPLTRQAEYPEMMRWQEGPALFVSLNINDKEIPANTKDGSAEVNQTRNAATVAWLNDAFETASSQQLSMLVIVMHGDPGFDDNGMAETSPMYRPLITLLKSKTEAFKGQVLLVHGGSGSHRIDHPLIDDKTQLPIQNFTRLETYGALQQGWVEVSVSRNKAAGDDPVTRTEFRFESFPWPPLSNEPEGTAETRDQ
jgi:hypothetical protein